MNPSKVLSGSNAIAAATTGDLTLELPMAEAQRFLAALRTDLLLQQETARSWGINPSEVQTLVTQLTRQIFRFGATTSAAAATAIQFAAAIAVTLPYAFMKNLTNALIAHSKNPNLYQPAFYLQEMQRRVGQRPQHRDCTFFESPLFYNTEKSRSWFQFSLYTWQHEC